MISLPVLTAVTSFPAVVYGAGIAQNFVPAAYSPTSASSNYVGANNGSLPKTNVTAGKVFDRFIQIWIENTDFQVAASTPEYQALAKEGIELTSYYAVTHPSEPNYIASMSGDFWGAGDDNFYAIPDNITTVVDLLEDGGNSGGKNLSWACYSENLPYDNFLGINYTSTNYISPGSAPYTYYQRKHNPCAIHSSISGNPARATRNRNFNDFAADVNASVLPQWVFVTPNMVNDGHDTSPAFFGNWTQWWLGPLLNNTDFNDNRTLVLLTFDENDSYSAENRIFSLLLGGAVPANKRGTTDDTYYTHYSSISTVQANWQLKNLGRNDVNKTMSNVYSLVANVTGFKNTDVPEGSRPLTNLTGIFDGPLNANQYVPYTAPANLSAIGAGGQGVLIIGGLNTSFTPSVAPEAVNLTASGQTVPSADEPQSSSSSGGSSKSAGVAVGVESRAVAVVVSIVAVALGL